MRGRVRIGTSGWEYDHWKGDFYPAKLPRRAWFDHYAARFDCVELNATFYRLPDGATFDAWSDRAPEGFSFAVKGSRYLTHVRRLRDPAEPLERLWSRVRRPGPRLGPILYQLPPRWKPDRERLEGFLDALPEGAAHVIEIRDARWYRPDILGAIREAGVSLCLHDMEGSAPVPEPIGPIAYLRFHGSGARYGGAYSSQRLAAWADRVAGWAAEGIGVWAFFNNDVGGHAVRDADRLRGFVERRLG